MVGAPPKLWSWLTTEWCALPASLAWTLWRAIVRAQWSTAAQWRDSQEGVSNVTAP
jgi:hypothetical protein